jgi:glycosyltransferase involved in cell wall biosynthesis
MKILLLNTYRKKGGAALATYRIFEGLQKKENNEVVYLTSEYFYGKYVNKLCILFDTFYSKLLHHTKKSLFSEGKSFNKINYNLNKFDIVNLFWINHGFISFTQIMSLKSPVVWTLHDMWPLTGGCHYDDGCGKFLLSCGNCPVLNSSSSKDISSVVFSKKLKLFNAKNINIIATSSWLYRLANLSPIFKGCKITFIPNGLDGEVFKKKDKEECRRKFGLPLNKFILFYSANSALTDKRKNGIDFLKIHKMIIDKYGSSDVHAVILGADSQEIPRMYKEEITCIKFLEHESEQIELYSAADVLVAPSLQENLSNTVLEAGACSLPVVAYSIGGMPDLIRHKFNGYLSDYNNVLDLFKGVEWLYTMDNIDQIKINARDFFIKNFEISDICNKYIDFYSKIIA